MSWVFDLCLVYFSGQRGSKGEKGDRGPIGPTGNGTIAFRIILVFVSSLNNPRNSKLCS